MSERWLPSAAKTEFIDLYHLIVGLFQIYIPLVVFLQYKRLAKLSAANPGGWKIKCFIEHHLGDLGLSEEVIGSGIDI